MEGRLHGIFSVLMELHKAIWGPNFAKEKDRQAILARFRLSAALLNKDIKNVRSSVPNFVMNNVQ